MATGPDNPFASAPPGLRPYYVPGLNSPNYSSLPTPSPYYATEEVDLIDSRVAARELINYAVLKYITTAVSCPFEVSRTLLQVQYTPSEEGRVAVANSAADPDAEYLADEEEDEDFYSDRRKPTDSDDMEPAGTATMGYDDPEFKQKVQLDGSGYVLRTSVYDDATRPPYQIPIVSEGVWQTIGRLMKQPHEGWRSLFKGQYTNWLYEISHLFLQPTLEGSLNDAFNLYDDTIPLVHLDHAGPNLATLVGSHAIVGALLSPLELVRTRLVVQSSSPLHRKYKGPLHCLRTIYAEEGGLAGLYPHLGTTLLYHSISPLLQNVTPLIIDRVLGISPNDSPFNYSLAELAFNMLEVIITLPLDTIRKRLHCQIRSRVPSTKRFATVVPLRPVPYTGLSDAVYSIIKEEGVPPHKNKGKKKAKDSATALGLRGLYQGFSMQCTANVILFLLHAINGVDDDYEDF